MTDVELIRDRLIGKNLLGFMPLNRVEYPNGDWDNAIALYIGNVDKPECYVLRSENGDYSCYDNWVIEKIENYIERDSRYKTIGETIDAIQKHEISDNEWNSGNNCYHFTIITKTKLLKFGHFWVDCHYPQSIWEEI